MAGLYTYFKLLIMKYLLAIVLMLSLSCSDAQNKTLKFNADTVSPKATLADVAWIAGHWKGEAFGGITEEIWSPPLGNSMMFSFKLVVDDKVVFYELGMITEKDGTLLLQLKHFDANLKGWEEKDESLSFKLVKLDNNQVFFDDFTFEKVSDDEINLYVVIKDKDKTEEIQFNYKRQ